MIPAQAVEAAHEQLEAMGAYVSRDYVESALEAAAPHIIAGHFRDMNLKAIANEIENPPNFSKGAP